MHDHGDDKGSETVTHRSTAQLQLTQMIMRLMTATEASEKSMSRNRTYSFVQEHHLRIHQWEELRSSTSARRNGTVKTEVLKCCDSADDDLSDSYSILCLFLYLLPHKQALQTLTLRVVTTPSHCDLCLRQSAEMDRHDMSDIHLRTRV